MRLAILLIALITAQVAVADPVVRVALIAVRGPGGMSTLKVVSQFNRTRRLIFNELGIHLRLTRVKKFSRNPYASSMTLESRKFLIGQWKNYARRHSAIADVFLVSLPPLRSDGKWWLAGQASGICNLRQGLAWAVAENVNQDGEDRRVHSKIVMAHELGHLLGCTHDDSSPNLMHSGAMIFGISNPDIGFNWTCKAESAGCLSR